MARSVRLVALTATLVLLAGCQPSEPVAVGTSPRAAIPTAAAPLPEATPASAVKMTIPPAMASCPAEFGVPDRPSGDPVHITAIKPDGSVVFDMAMYGEGLDAEGNLNPTQTDMVAWFNPDVRAEYPPGYPGSSVVAGHASTHGGAFRDLPALAQGDAVAIRYSSGDVVQFVVDRSATDLKSGLTDISTPLGAEIWDVDRQQMCRIVWLITCDLNTSQDAAGHRLGNVAVRLAFVGVANA